MSTPTVDCPECGLEITPDDIERAAGYPNYYCQFCDEKIAGSKSSKFGKKVHKMWEEGPKNIR